MQSKTGVTLVGAGKPSAKNITESLSLAPLLVAADGGANFCAEMGLEPSAIIGDFDSLAPDVRKRLSHARLIEVSERAEQDSTDFEKCLVRIDAPFVLAAGFVDARLDHTLASFSALARRIGPPTILLGSEDVAFAAPLELALELPVGTRFSLFPMEEMSGTSEGLEWPIDGLTLSPVGRIATSNQVTGLVQLRFEKPGCVVLTPRGTLSDVLQALIG